MNTQKMGKAPAGHVREGFSGNHSNNHFDGLSEGLSVFDNNEKQENSQQVCNLCNPSTEKGCGSAKLCAECTAKTEIFRAALFVHLAKPRKVVRLQRCLACNGCFAPSKFSQFYGICKNCVTTAEGKSKTAQSNFVERTANNIRKVLRGALAI